MEEIRNPEAVTVDQVLNLMLEQLENELPYLAYPGKEPVLIPEILDYGLANHRIRDKAFSSLCPKTTRFEAIVSTGSSEGVYTDVYAKAFHYDDKKENETIRLFTFKSLQGGYSAYAAMGVIAGLVTRWMEHFLWANY